MTDSIRGSVRELIDLDEYNEQMARGTLIIDERRRRPLWFDGRFLDAEALKSEQYYIMARQADIAKVAGTGVSHGLFVERTDGRARTVDIESGYGVTPSGEMVIIAQDMQIDLSDVPVIQKLDASFGLSKIPKQSAINRSGLFIIALRPVEYTDRPIASYPISINEQRSIEDGNIVEATAITLIPYPDQGSRVELDQRRKYAVQEIFIDNSKKGQPTGVLPIAMVALNLGVIQWLDVFMVRRDVGAADHDVLGLGLSSRVLKESYLRQYHTHLFEILGQSSTGNTRITASDHFTALPAAGPMPVTSIDKDTFTQSFFPSEMDVDISIIAEDELPALIEDSYTLPELDLSLNSEQFDSTSVLVVIPVKRARLREFSITLKSLVRPLSTNVPGLVAKRKPITALRDLDLRRLSRVSIRTKSPDENIWRQVLSDVEIVWYIRRRNISYKETVTAMPESLVREEMVIEESITSRLKELGLVKVVGNIKRRGTTLAEVELVRLFSSPVMLEGSGITTKAAVYEINKLKTVDRSSVLKVVERFTTPSFGEGISRLESRDTSITSSKKKSDVIIGSGKLPELDRIAKALPPMEFDTFTRELVTKATGSKASSKKVASLIGEKYKTLDNGLTTLAYRRQLESEYSLAGKQ